MVSYQPHPEVWLLLAGLVALGLYATRVIGPKVVPAGSPVVTTTQKRWFVGGVVLLWLATDWPMHDISEERLYAVHMVQHLLLTFALPAMFLKAIPEWLARLVVGDGWVAGSVLRRLAHPIAAGVIFNAVALLSHWQATVNLSVENGAFHYGMHTLLVFSALLMWTPVCGPLPELRISLPAQMVYLFAMSIVPTVPAAWLTFAEGIVYSAYDTPERLWGVSATTDQQLAGLVMKLVAGFWLWGLIVYKFFLWASRNQKADKAGRLVTEQELLRWDEVERELRESNVR